MALWLVAVAVLVALVFFRAIRRRLKSSELVAAPEAVVLPAVERTEARSDEPPLTPVQLARILGNCVPEDEQDNSAPVDGGEDSQKPLQFDPATTAMLQQYVDACVATREIRAQGDQQLDGFRCEEVVEEDLGPSGSEVLTAMEGDDSQHALEVVRTASTAAINFEDEVKRNALLLAVSEGHLEACRALLARPDFRGINARNTIGSTALHLAAANGETEVCKEILACPRFTLGVNAENNNGQTPLDFSLEFGEGDASEVLRAGGGNSSGRAMRSRQARGIPETSACRLRPQAPAQAADEFAGNDMGALD